MKDLYKAIDALKNIVNEAPPQGRQDGPGTRQGTTPKPKPAGPAAYNSVGDMMKAISTPGRQGVADPKQSARNVAAAQPKPAPAAPKPKPAAFTGRPDDAQKPAAAPKINPAVPAAGPVRANPINPQAMAATKAAASVVNTPKPAAPAPRAKVKATAANTKDYDKTVALQKKLGVTADGIMGPQTRAAMAKAAGSPEPTGTARKVSTVAPDAAPTKTASTPTDAGEFATAAPTQAASGQDAAKARVARSNAALAKDFGKVKDAGKSMISRIAGAFTGGGNRRAERDAENQASAQAYRDRRSTTRTASAPAAASDMIASLPNATTTDRAGNISPAGRPRQPSDPAPTTRRERGTVPGQGAGTRTVSVGGQQVSGAEADRAINVAQAGADNARLRMGAARAGMTIKDYQAQQNRLNKASGDRMMKTAKASDAGVF